MQGINGGTTLRITAPNSGLIINFPVIETFAKQSQPETGVGPNINLVPTNEQDLVDTNWPVKELVKQLSE